MLFRFLRNVVLLSPMASLLTCAAQLSKCDGWTEQAKRPTEAMHIVVLSDSTARVHRTGGVGYGPNDGANLWPNQLKTALKRAFPGDAGSSGLLTLEANAASFDPDNWHVSGPYAYNPEFGPFQAALTEGGHVPDNGSTIKLDRETTATSATQYGDTIWVYWLSCPESNSLSVSVDGRAQATISGGQTGFCQAKRTQAYVGSLGPHTLTIAPGATNAYVYAAEWTVGHGGTAVDNLAIGGATSRFFSGPAKLAYVHTIPNVRLVIVALGINDFLHAVPLAEYKSNLSTIVDNLKQWFPSASILIVNQYQVVKEGYMNASNLSQAEYWKVGTELATENHLCYLSLDKTWGTASASVSGGWLTSDAVHPSDQGGKQFAKKIGHLLTLDAIRSPARSAVGSK